MRRLRPTHAPGAIATALVVAGAAIAGGGIAGLSGYPGLLVLAGVALFLTGLYRWYTRGEGIPGAEESRRQFGDSIMDARTNQDPMVGMRPVDTTHERH